jgi:uncharacterized protein (TIGR03663 family)
MEFNDADPQEEQDSWLDRPLLTGQTIKWTVVIFIVILLIALISRIYMLDTRVMSHDETSHVYFSWIFEQGRGYSHDPVTHGPLQFHLIALSYFLFGDSDFSARLPHAIASILSVAFLWYYRRYLGKIGWIVAAVLMVISPYMLYYGRYARNEALVVLFGLITIWAILRYSRILLYRPGLPISLVASGTEKSLYDRNITGDYCCHSGWRCSSNRG